MSALSKSEAVSKTNKPTTRNISGLRRLVTIADFYDINSMTCSSELFDPSVESDYRERSLQHRVGWANLTTEKGGRPPIAPHYPVVCQV